MFPHDGRCTFSVSVLGDDAFVRKETFVSLRWFDTPEEAIAAADAWAREFIDSALPSFAADVTWH
jgi:hypothetical protein